MIENRWLNDFDEVRRNMIEDALFLDALARYVSNDGPLLRGDSVEYFIPAFRRLCDYLSQHAWELHRIGKQCRPDL